MVTVLCHGDLSTPREQCISIQAMWEAEQLAAQPPQPGPDANVREILLVQPIGSVSPPSSGYTLFRTDFIVSLLPSASVWSKGLKSISSRTGILSKSMCSIKYICCKWSWQVFTSTFLVSVLWTSGDKTEAILAGQTLVPLTTVFLPRLDSTFCRLPAVCFLPAL